MFFQPGIVAVSVAERLTYDERIDHAARVIMTPSLILIWSFADPIHPQVGRARPETLYKGDDALSTKPVMHYQGTAYLCY